MKPAQLPSLLNDLQGFESNAVSRSEALEVGVRKEARLAYSTEEKAERIIALQVGPLPWRYCAPLIFLASATCYALAFLVVAGFNRLLTVL